MSILGMGIRTLADTIVHVVYPFGNVDTFHTPQEDQPDDIYFAELGSVQALADAAVTETTYDSGTHTLTFKNSEGDELYTIELDKIGVGLVLNTSSNKVDLVDTKGYVLGSFNLKSDDDSIIITSSGSSINLKQAKDITSFKEAQVIGTGADRVVRFYNIDGDVVDSILLPDTALNAFVSVELVGNKLEFYNSDGIMEDYVNLDIDTDAFYSASYNVSNETLTFFNKTGVAVESVLIPQGGSGGDPNAFVDAVLVGSDIQFKNSEGVTVSTITLPSSGGDPNAFVDAEFNTSTSKLEFYNSDNDLVDSVTIPVFVGPSKPIGRYPLPDAFGINDAFDYDKDGTYPTTNPNYSYDLRNITVFVSCSHTNIIDETYSDVEDIQYQLTIDRIIAEVQVNYVWGTYDITPYLMTGSLTFTNLVNGSRTFSLANGDLIHFSLAEVLSTTNSSKALRFTFEWEAIDGLTSTYVTLPISSESAGTTGVLINIITTDNLRYNSLTNTMEFKKLGGVSVFDVKLTVDSQVIVTMYDIATEYAPYLRQTSSKDIVTSTIHTTIDPQYQNDEYSIVYKPNGLSTFTIPIRGVNASAW